MPMDQLFPWLSHRSDRPLFAGDPYNPTSGLTGEAAPPSSARVIATEVPTSPYQAASRLLGRVRPVFLDSSLAGGVTGRYSYLTADPFLIVRSRGRCIELIDRTGTAVLDGDPFEVIQGLLHAHAVEPVFGLPPFLGGAIGYFSYDLVRLLEDLPCLTESADTTPDMDLGVYDWVLAADHATGKNWLIETSFAPPAGTQATARWTEIRESLGRPCKPHERTNPAMQFVRSNVRRTEYLTAVERAQAYISAGDIYQVNLSHRLEGRWSGPIWPLYERLRAASPVPFGAYLDLGHTTILSASPERFLQLGPEDRRVDTRPIKGTRPRGATEGEDNALVEELLSSEKDRAEHLMIVDLMRNDLGKVCAIGTVHVPELFRLEPYATVWQMVSVIRGTLRPELDAIDLLKACFPGGSVTGCPKIRAMEIIEELEPVQRGIYCGAIGYISFTGAMDTSIVIRTMMITGDRLHLQVGGAIVADSQPAAEYTETIVKARAGLDALCAQVEDR